MSGDIGNYMQILQGQFEQYQDIADRPLSSPLPGRGDVSGSSIASFKLLIQVGLQVCVPGRVGPLLRVLVSSSVHSREVAEQQLLSGPLRKSNLLNRNSASWAQLPSFMHTRLPWRKPAPELALVSATECERDGKDKLYQFEGFNFAHFEVHL
eukprot:749716-Amphidinium_carterae.1